MQDIVKVIKEDKEKLKSYLKSKSGFFGNDFTLFIPKKHTTKKNICLVSHIDTVHDTPQYSYRKKHFWYEDFGQYEFKTKPKIRHNKKVYCDTKQGVIWSPDGLGADDRAGVYACLELYKTHNCFVLFTDYEESGGRGAREALEKTLPRYGSDISLFIEIDRKGNNQMVFYNGEPQEFRDFFGSFGFKEHTGSFSDISILCRNTGFHGVNLSAGYYKEHTLQEYLNIKHLMNTVRKIDRIFKS